LGKLEKGKTYSEIFSVIGGYVTLKRSIYFSSVVWEWRVHIEKWNAH
jgi:hypothetical protein